MTVPYDNLDSRLIDDILYTGMSNIDNIIQDIDNNNTKIEQDVEKNIKIKQNTILKKYVILQIIHQKNMILIVLKINGDKCVC